MTKKQIYALLEERYKYLDKAIKQVDEDQKANRYSMVNNAICETKYNCFREEQCHINKILNK